MPKSSSANNRYSLLIDKLFQRHYRKGVTEFEFEREEIENIASELEIKLPKNLGDLIYSFRYRLALPKSISSTAIQGKEWIIEGTGRAKYAFKLVTLNRILPRSELVTIKVPDATPEIMTAYALDDEQALLAKVRYNRLTDIFLSLTTYSLQNHLRTTVKGLGQIEIDELYIGIDKHGCHYVIPIQAKGGKDQISVVQTRQDIRWCNERFPGIACRAISAQFMSDDTIAMFELTVEEDLVKVVDERHYKLVPSSELDSKAIRQYRTQI